MKLNLATLLLIVMSALVTSSCEKENLDLSTTQVGTYQPNIILTGTPTENCEPALVLNSDAVSLSPGGVAYLIKSACAEEVDDYDHNYLIVLEPDFDLTTLGRLIDRPKDGMPGFGFGSNGAPQSGDQLEIYGRENWRPWITNDWQNSANLTLTFAGNTIIEITTGGTEVGSFVGGSISGNLVDPFGPNGDILYPFTGNFCVPIVEVCE